MAVDTTTTVRHNQVDKNGRIEIAGPASITIGSVLTGAIDAVIRTGNYAHMFIKRTLIRELTIDSTKKSQPLYYQRWKTVKKKPVRENTGHLCEMSRDNTESV